MAETDGTGGEDFDRGGKDLRACKKSEGQTVYE